MSFKDQLIEFIEKHFDGTQQETEPTVENIAKSVDIEKRLFTAVVLRPNVPDLHGDIYDEDVVEQACHDYVQYCQKANLQHLVQTELATFVESSVAKSNYQLGDGEVLKGDWVLTMKINDDALWEMCKEGSFTGFSVGCMATTEKLSD